MRSTRDRGLRLLALFLVLAAACRRGDSDAPKKTEAPPPAAAPAMAETVHLSSAAVAEAGISSWKVEPVDLEHLLVLNGVVKYDENVVVGVASNVAGRISSIPVDLGALVRKDEPLVWLESAELGKAREEWIRELSQLRVASRSYDRARRLVAEKAISQGEFQARESEYQSKKAAAQAAERSLALMGQAPAEMDRIRSAVEGGEEPATPSAVFALRAPFSGRVLERHATPGSLIEPMKPIVTLADLSTLWVFLQVYEKDLALIRSGLPIRLRAEAYPQETFEGRIDFLGGAVEESSRTIGVRATVRNPGEKLRPGMFVKARVEVPRPQAENRPMVVVPQTAIQTLEGRTTVFLQKESGVFARRFVETGHTFEGFTEILSGVKPGETVVTEGSFVLKSEFAKAEFAAEE